VQWARRHVNVVLFAVLLLGGGTWAFIELADEVAEGETQRIDDAILRLLRRSDDPSRPIGPDWLAEAGRDMTAMGGVLVLVLVTAAVVGYLAMVQKHGAVVLVLVASLGGLAISSGLKHHYKRPRPNVVPHLSYVVTSSFPSGHAMMSSTVYLTLGALLSRFTARRWLKIYYMLVALVLVFLIGISRVFVGVHYPTDVLAGWSAGLCWAIVCWLVATYLQRRGTVEADTD
jgi:undecaprenyl-diphosphatase